METEKFTLQDRPQMMATARLLDFDGSMQKELELSEEGYTRFLGILTDVFLLDAEIGELKTLAVLVGLCESIQNKHKGDQ